MFARRLAPLALALLGCANSSSRPVADVPIASPPSTPDPIVVVEPPSPTPPAPAPAPALASARPLHEGRVLLTTEASPAWATGPVLSLEANEYHEKWTIQRAVMLDALPPEVSTFVGMTVDLYGPAGRQCTVTLDTLTIEVHLEMQYVDGDYVRPGADALWESLATTEDQATVLLVASFAADPRCAGALWARDASLPAPDVLVLGDPREHAALLADEHRRALASEAGQKFVGEYQEFAADAEFAEWAEPWASASEGLRQVWIDQHGVPQLVTLSFGDHSFSPCHWQGPSYGVARQLADDPASSEALKLQASVVYDPAPVAVFDADLDGRYELLIVQPWGDLNFVEIVSLTRALRLDLMLPDGSYVWC